MIHDSASFHYHSSLSLFNDSPAWGPNSGDKRKGPILSLSCSPELVKENMLLSEEWYTSLQ